MHYVYILGLLPVPGHYYIRLDRQSATAPPPASGRWVQEARKHAPTKRCGDSALALGRDRSASLPADAAGPSFTLVLIEEAGTRGFFETGFPGFICPCLFPGLYPAGSDSRDAV